MTTVGTLAYSLTADSSKFTAGVAASKAELKELKAAFQGSLTDTDRYAMAIQRLEDLAQKFPAKADVMRAAIHRIREEMAGGGGGGGFHQGAEGAGELAEGLERINSRLGRMTIGEVMGQLRAIPGLTIAIDAAFGNWIGAAVGAFSLAHELMEETETSINKTASAYENATEKLVAFYEAEQKAREKGRAPDRLTDSHLTEDAEKAALEIGLGRLGYAGSGTFLGKGQRGLTWLMDQVTKLEFGTSSETNERAIELGKEQIQKELESRRLAEKEYRKPGEFYTDTDLKSLQAQQKEFDKFLDIRRKATDDEFALEKKHADEIEKQKLDTANRVLALEGRQYADNERKAAQIASAQRTDAEKLRDDFKELQDLNKGGFFDLFPEAYQRALEGLQTRAEGMSGFDKSTAPGVTSAITIGSHESLQALYGGKQGTTEKQLAEEQKTAKNTADANMLLTNIKDAIAANQLVVLGS